MAKVEDSNLIINSQERSAYYYRRKIGQSTEINDYIPIVRNPIHNTIDRSSDWQWLTGLKHQNLLRYFGIDLKEEEMELLSYTDTILNLPELVSRQRLDEYCILTFTSQLFSALSYLHTQKDPIVIGNLDLEIIWVTSDQKMVKIACLDKIITAEDPKKRIKVYNKDFRFSPIFLSPDALIPVLNLKEQNTHHYLSHNRLDQHIQSNNSDRTLFIGRRRSWPDIIEEKKILPAMDIWSLGCVILGMYTRNNIAYRDTNGILLNQETDYEILLLFMLNGGQPDIPKEAPCRIKLLCQMCLKKSTSTVHYTASQLYNITNEFLVQTSAEEQVKEQKTFISFAGRFGTQEYKCFLEELAGEGCYGKVYLVNTAEDDNEFQCNTKTKYALKILHQNDTGLKTDGLSQLDSLQLIRHKHLINYIAVGKVEHENRFFLPETMLGRTCILMEFCEGGTLNSLAKKIKLSETEILNFSRQIVDGVKYLHEKQIIHGDLKGENIFLTIQEIVKIGDIDAFIKLRGETTCRSDVKEVLGTRRHMSPEMLKKYLSTLETKENVGRLTDVWSVGCTIVKMFSRGNVPYVDAKGRPWDEDAGQIQHIQMVKLAECVGAGGHPDYMYFNSSANFCTTIKGCLG